MRVPPKGDPHGDKEGALPRDIVLKVLKENSVRIAPSAEHRELFQFTKNTENGETIELHSLPPLIGGILIKKLARTFEINTAEFYYDLAKGERRFKPRH